MNRFIKLIVVLAFTSGEYSLAADPTFQATQDELSILFSSSQNADEVKALQAYRNGANEPMRLEEIKRARNTIVKKLKETNAQWSAQIEVEIQNARQQGDLNRANLLLATQQNLATVRDFLVETKDKLSAILNKGKCDPILNKLFRKIGRQFDKVSLGCDSFGRCLASFSIAIAAMALVATFPAHMAITFLVSAAIISVAGIAFEEIKDKNEGSCWGDPEYAEYP